MALIETMAPESADGEIAAIYKSFLDGIGMIPKPIEMFSASPGLCKIQGELIGYYRSHPNLDISLTTLIRFLVAHHIGYQSCVTFNTAVLKRLGMDEKEIEAVISDPESAPLEKKDKVMLLFVIKAMKTPEFVTQEDMVTLRDQGWSDSDIFDALNHAALMLGPSIMMKALKMDG